MEEFNISYSPVIRFTDLKILYIGTFANYESYENVYHVIRDCFRGFSDSLLASRQLYTEAPSHKLSAMLTEVRQKFSSLRIETYFGFLQVGLPTREEHDALEDAVDCRRICRRMAGKIMLLNLYPSILQSIHSTQL